MTDPLVKHTFEPKNGNAEYEALKEEYGQDAFIEGLPMSLMGGLNDGHDIAVDSASLVGRASPDRGSAEKIIPRLPLFIDASTKELRVNGAFRFITTTVDASPDAGDYVNCISDDQAITVYLPPGAEDGDSVRVTRSGTNDVTVLPGPDQTINGILDFVMIDHRRCEFEFYDGDWRVFTQIF